MGQLYNVTIVGELIYAKGNSFLLGDKNPLKIKGSSNNTRVEQCRIRNTQATIN